MRNTLSQIGPLRDWWPLFGGVGVGLLAFLGIAGFAILIDQLAAGPDGKARALCDQMVERLLTTSEAVEVMRAGIIIERLNCSLRRRL